MSRPYHLRRILAGLAALCLAPTAVGGPCAGRLSPCVELNNLWVPTTDSPFVSLEGTESVELKAKPPILALRTISSWQHRPLILRVPSGTPNGREVPVVEDHLTTQLAVRVAHWKPFAFGVVLTAGFRPSGVGLEGLNSEGGPTSGRAGLGDPRLFCNWSVPSRSRLKLQIIQQVALPLGARASWLTGPGPTYAPGLALNQTWGRFTLGAELGARIRQSTQLGDTLFGSEGRLAVGIHQRLNQTWSLSLESWILAGMNTARSTPQDGSADVSIRRIPAEWLLAGHFQLRWLKATLGLGSTLGFGKHKPQSANRTSSLYVSSPPGAAPRLLSGAQIKF